jgi:TetR/AcrR family transcriptional repressor of bet genes
MPKVVDHEERRRAITAAACQVIASAGLNGTTMRDIATEAGCTTGMVMHYFRSKEEVLLAALGSASQAVADRMVALLEAASTDLYDLLCECLPMDDRRRSEWRVWIAFWDSAAHDPELAVEQRARYRTWREALQFVLLTMGYPQGGHLEEVAETLMTVIDGIGIQAIFDTERWPPDRQERQMRRQVRHILTDRDQNAPPV